MLAGILAFLFGFTQWMSRKMSRISTNSSIEIVAPARVWLEIRCEFLHIYLTDITLSLGFLSLSYPLPREDMIEERTLETNDIQESSSIASTSSIASSPHEKASSADKENHPVADKQKHSSTDKQNTSVKSRGRGRPAGKAISPDQLIKPTKDSLTAR